MILCCSFKGAAQSSQYVTLTATYAYGGFIGGLGGLGTGGNNFAVQPNQTVSRVGYDAGSTSGGIESYGQYQDGTFIKLESGQIFTGLTNISVFLGYSGGLPPPPPPIQPGAATFQITTPASVNVFQLCPCRCDCHSRQRNRERPSHSRIQSRFGELDCRKSRNLRSVSRNKQIFQSSRSHQLSVTRPACVKSKIRLRFRCLRFRVKSNVRTSGRLSALRVS